MSTESGARSSSRVSWRNTGRDKPSRLFQHVFGDTKTAREKHLKWCRYMRDTYLERKRSKGQEKLQQSWFDYVSQRHSEYGDVVDQVESGIRYVNGKGKELLEKSPLSLLKRVLGVPRNLDAMTVIQDRFAQVLRRRFSWLPRLYRGAQAIRDAKCPVCGGHSIRRLCWDLTFRLFDLTIDHCLDVLGSHGAGPEERQLVVSCLIGWRKFGFGATDDVVSDFVNSLRLLGVNLSTLTVIGFWWRMASELADVVYVLTGRSVTIPNMDDFVRAVRLDHSRRRGALDPDAIVWDAWLALDRCAFSSFRGLLLRWVRPQAVRSTTRKVLTLQQMWFSDGRHPELARELELLEVKEGASVGWFPFQPTPMTFQEACRWAVEKQKPPANIVTGGPPPPPPPGPPPPPPPPPGTIRGKRFDPPPYSTMSIAEREVRYLAGEPWPRCHPGWVCPKPDRHCEYVIPGVVPTVARELGPELEGKLLSLLEYNVVSVGQRPIPSVQATLFSRIWYDWSEDVHGYYTYSAPRSYLINE